MPRGPLTCHIKMIGRLVEKKDMWVFHRQDRKYHSVIYEHEYYAFEQLPNRFRNPSDSWSIAFVWCAPVIPKRPIC